MTQDKIHDSELVLGRVGFGTASLHHIGSVAEQVKYLRSVADLGFTHFDTAPLYGFGMAERAIGLALGASRDITIATKVGLYPPGGASQGRLSVNIRKAVGKAIPVLSRVIVDYTVATARLSIADSMKRLRRDYIDLLLLHEPQFSLIRTDEWQRFLEDQGDSIGAIGVAGPSSVLEPFIQADCLFASVVQTRDSLVTREADFLLSAGRPLQLTYGYFTGGHNTMNGDDIIMGALVRNHSGTVLFSSRSLARLERIPRIAERAVLVSEHA